MQIYQIVRKVRAKYSNPGSPAPVGKAVCSAHTQGRHCKMLSCSCKYLGCIQNIFSSFFLQCWIIKGWWNYLKCIKVDSTCSYNNIGKYCALQPCSTDSDCAPMVQGGHFSLDSVRSRPNSGQEGVGCSVQCTKAIDIHMYNPTYLDWNPKVREQISEITEEEEWLVSSEKFVGILSGGSGEPCTYGQSFSLLTIPLLSSLFVPKK